MINLGNKLLGEVESVGAREWEIVRMLADERIYERLSGRL
jgi:hypothetical protein